MMNLIHKRLGRSMNYLDIYINYNLIIYEINNFLFIFFYHKPYSIQYL